MQKYNEIPICDDVFKHVLLPFLTIYDLLKIVTTNKQFKKLIQNTISNHPYNLHNAIQEGPRNRQYERNPFILPKNPQNYIWVGANLEGAILIGADLYDANLTDANLTDSNLEGANLEGAKTNDSNFHQNYPNTILIK